MYVKFCNSGFCQTFHREGVWGREGENLPHTGDGNALCHEEWERSKQRCCDRAV